MNTMAKYTTEVRSICEELSGFGHGGYADVDEIIAGAVTKIFDFSFPIFDESYRVPLEKKILLSYYTREIGLETYGLWKLKLKSKLNMIMPYYNKLYKSELIEFNPMHNMDVTTVHDRTMNEKQDDKTTATTNDDYSGTADTSGADYNLYNNTPQGGLEGVDSMTYLTEATKVQHGTIVTDDNSRTIDEDRNFDGNRDVTENWTDVITGKNSGESFSEMLLKFRETFLNIDQMVIEELEELFMGVW